MVYGSIYFIFLLVDAQVLTLITSVGLYIKELLSVWNWRSEVRVFALCQGRWLFPATIHPSHLFKVLWYFHTLSRCFWCSWWLIMFCSSQVMGLGSVCMIVLWFMKMSFCVISLVPAMSTTGFCCHEPVPYPTILMVELGRPIVHLNYHSDQYNILGSVSAGLFLLLSMMVFGCLTVTLHQFKKDNISKVVWFMKLMSQIFAATILFLLIESVSWSGWSKTFSDLELRS